MSRQQGIASHWHFLVLLAFVIADVLSYAGRGWLPHDEGLLGQSAARVLQGELPHRDFDDTYTGGQAILHAMVFHMLGQDSFSLRIVLGVLSIGALLAVYFLALRLTNPLVACLGTATGYVWSIPIYFAPLPSWYNLFLGLFGMCALVRFAETKREPWLILAGLMGGLSFLIKISGLYYVAAAFLFLLLIRPTKVTANDRIPRTLADGTAKNQLASQPQVAAIRESYTKLPIGITLAVVIPFLMAVCMLIRNRWTAMDLIHFVFPSVAVIIVLCTVQSQRQAKLGDGYFTDVLRSFGLFGLGLLAPIALFLIPYAASGSVQAWMEGVFIMPQRRLGSASHPLPGLETLLYVLPVALVLLAKVPADSWFRGRAFFTLFFVTCIIVAMAGGLHKIYLGIGGSARPLVPLLVGLGCVHLVRQARKQPLSRKEEFAFLFLAMTATMSLVQFPFSYLVYFSYIAPLVALSAVAVSTLGGISSRNLQLCVLVCYLLFGLIWLRTGHVSSVGNKILVVLSDEPLELERASLTIPSFEANLYREMIDEVQKRSEPGSAILAMSDCPEVYFLSNRRNPTRTLYDFFDADFRSDPEARRNRLLALVKKEQIRCVILRWKGEFSGEMDEKLANSLAALFPNRSDYRFFPDATSSDKPDFSVLWK